MTNMELLTLIKDVQEFAGSPEELGLFIKHVDFLYEFASELNETSKYLLELKIRQKIKESANTILINNNNPIKWPEIKSILLSNCTINESVETLITQIKLLKFESSVSNLFNDCSSLLTKLNIKTGLAIETPSWFNNEQNEAMVLKLFINKLPSDPKLILQARNPSSLRQAKEILVDTDNFYRSFSQNKNRQSSFLQNNNSSQHFYSSTPNSFRSPGHFQNSFPRHYQQNLQNGANNRQGNYPGNSGYLRQNNSRIPRNPNANNNFQQSNRINNSGHSNFSQQNSRNSAISRNNTRNQSNIMEVDHFRTENMPLNKFEQNPNSSHFQNFPLDTSEHFPV